MRRFTSAVAIAAGSILTVGAAAAQAQDFEVHQSFDAAAAELPEGVSIDPQGVTYVTLGPPFFVEAGPGWVTRITEDGSVDTLAEFDDGAPAGVVAGPGDEVYFARPNPSNEGSRGVYRLSADGTLERLPGTEALLVANGLALDGTGGLFASDSALGTIWHIPLDGSDPEPWYSDQALVGGCGGEGEVGANGVALWKDGLYVANTSRGLLVRIDIEADGSAGPAEVIAGDDTNDCQPDALFGMDGIALDSEGTIYAALVLQNQLVRIDPGDGSFDVLLTADDGLHNPASLAFGTTDGDRTSLYITNYAVLDPEPENSPGPALLRFEAGVEGAPLP